VGKTEMWYAVDAQVGAEVFVGLKPGVTRQVFRRAIDDGTAEECLAREPMSRGDSVFVPAGTAHTIGQGLVLCEIQQTSDITYRVYDYGRVQPDGTPRKLHVKQAMEVLNFDSQRGGKLAPARIAMPEGERIALVACKYFAVEKWKFSKAIALKTAPERFEIWIAIAGDGKISWSAKGAGRTVNYSAAESWFVPAALGEWRIEPTSETTMLRVFVPDLKGYAAELAASGVSSEDSAQVIRK
jgi:mannose-6-phosphate isomerase